MSEQHKWVAKLLGYDYEIQYQPGHENSIADALAEAADAAFAAEAAQQDAAAALTGLDVVVAGLPAGWRTHLGRGGAGLSVGQRQRVALTRALLSDAPLVVLDEPTAHLDAAGEQVVLATVRALTTAGRTVVLVAHRPSLVALADQVVTVRSAALATATPGATR